jgi:hypothetical protein
MIDGLELVSNTIVRYTIVEGLYQESLKDIKPAFRDLFESLLVKVYTAILSYLAKAR